MADPSRDIIVIGASAGGVQALQRVAAGLPPDLPAAVFVVLHVWPWTESSLPLILSRAGLLHAAHPQPRDPIRHGRIYVAPPDRHLVLHQGFVDVSHGPRENMHRPSIDVLFRSAARVYGNRVCGVLLTGSDDDGSAGLGEIRQAGGLAVVQDPTESEFPQMPLSALSKVEIDHCVRLGELAPLLNRIARHPVAQATPNAEAAASIAMNEDTSHKPPNTSSGFVCPECGGALWELTEGNVLKYRCRVGHGFSAEALIEGESDGVERALWAAVRQLEENAAVLRRLAERAPVIGADFERKAQEREHHATVIRELLGKD